MFDAQKTENQITTYMERSLHASLKKHFCPNEDMHEIKMGRFVADACDGKTIFESAKISADYTLKCIENTQGDKNHWYGAKFETALDFLIKSLT